MLLAPVTMIQAERITVFTCTVEEDTARGVISFEVPKLYAGKVDYVAQGGGEVASRGVPPAGLRDSRAAGKEREVGAAVI